MTRARIFSQTGGTSGGGNAFGAANITLSVLQKFLTTANVTELTNLYFSNTRVFANLRLASLNDLYDVDTTYKANGQALLWNSVSNVWYPGNIVATILNTDYLNEGTSNLYYTNARARTAFTAGDPTISIDWTTGTIRANVSAIANSASTTDGVSEGYVNKYFTNARVFANLQLASLNDLYDVDIYPYATNNQVLVYNQDTGKWFASTPSVTHAFFADYSGEANVVLQINNFTTDNLVEGANNFYLTYSKLANILTANVSINLLKDVDTSQPTLAAGNVLTYDGNTWVPRNIVTTNSVNASNANVALFAYRANVANTVVTLNNFTTANLIESSSNLYFTYARANATIWPSLTAANIANFNSTVNATVYPSLTTANITELTNQYFTNVRVLQAVNPLLTTSNVLEGSNFYFTNARVLTALQFADTTTTYNLTAQGNLIVNGVFTRLQASNVETAARFITVARDATTLTQAEGAGIRIAGANASISYGQAGDYIGINKNLVIYGNILPAVSGTFQLGSRAQKWKDLFLGTQTLYIGDFAIGQTPSGGLFFGNADSQAATNLQTGNIAATQLLTVDRIFNSSEINSYIGGNVFQFLVGTTANLYLGIKKSDDFNKFAGIRISELKDATGNVYSDVIIYNDKEGTNNSTARISVLATGNVNINAQATVYGNLDVKDHITTDRIIYANTNHTLKVYQYYNESTQSLDTIFL
jgi:hypothetical protein